MLISSYSIIAKNTQIDPIYMVKTQCHNCYPTLDLDLPKLQHLKYILNFLTQINNCSTSSAIVNLIETMGQGGIAIAVNLTCFLNNSG